MQADGSSEEQPSFVQQEKQDNISEHGGSQQPAGGTSQENPSHEHKQTPTNDGLYIFRYRKVF